MLFQYIIKPFLTCFSIKEASNNDNNKSIFDLTFSKSIKSKKSDIKLYLNLSKLPMPKILLWVK